MLLAASCACLVITITLTAGRHHVAARHIVAKCSITIVGPAVLMERVILCASAALASEKHDVARGSFDHLETPPCERVINLGAPRVCIKLRSEDGEGVRRIPSQVLAHGLLRLRSRTRADCQRHLTCAGHSLAIFVHLNTTLGTVTSAVSHRNVMKGLQLC